MTQQESRKPGGQIEIADGDFDETVTRNRVVVMDFWAPWCQPCLRIAPIMNELSRELSGRALFTKLNIDENPRVPMRFHVRSIPTIMIFKEGKAVDQIIGFATKDALRKRISDNI